jgi:hypothetical protein
VARLDRLECRTWRPRSAIADIAAQQTVHRTAILQILANGGDGVELVGGFLEGKRHLELPHRVAVLGHGRRHGELALGVEPQQLLRHVAHALLDARLGLVPGRAAQLIEARRHAFDAAVLLQQIEPLERQEQPAAIGVGELHHLALRRAGALQHRHRSGRRAARCGVAADLAQGDELADAVVGVHHEVADLEIPHARHERAEAAARPSPRGARQLDRREELRLREHHQARRRQAKTPLEISVHQFQRRDRRRFPIVQQIAQPCVVFARRDDDQALSSRPCRLPPRAGNAPADRVGRGGQALESAASRRRPQARRCATPRRRQPGHRPAATQRLGRHRQRCCSRRAWVSQPAVARARGRHARRP